ncbi:MAG: hypothetical protein ABI776_05385 [Nocardioidaceae bacterium]
MTLQQRGATARTAALTARVALAVFDVAYDDWVEDTSGDVDDLMRQAPLDVRSAVVGRVAAP